MRVFAPAKVNLCLHVTGRAPGGYHAIESLIAFADIGDWVDVAPGAGSLEATGPFAYAMGPPADNLATRALHLFNCADKFTIRIAKNVPVAAGLGGGSADAGAVARALVTSGETPRDLLPLGADTPACYIDRPCWSRGRGEILTPLTVFPAVPLLLVHPGVPCPTAPIFAAFGGGLTPPLADPPKSFTDIAGLLAFLAQTHNALEDSARALVPQITEALAALHKSGAALVRMSGSGAACFGLFTNAQDLQSGTDRIQIEHPDWWVSSGYLKSFPLFLQGVRGRSS